MKADPAPIEKLLGEIAEGRVDAEENIAAALSRANSNASRNTYITLDAEWSREQARRLIAGGRQGLLAGAPVALLAGLPVALKDCFDLEGFVTTSGSRFYAQHLAAANADSWVAERLKAAGAVLTGKTHLHQLAYGITGENLDYGHCVQPENAALLTGGSSSGSAAAVQEGSALAAIGTDTGGSIRAPAALCGLAGYRASLGVGDWRGGAHLAPSFDTIGWLCRDLRDLPLLARALFDLPPARSSANPARVGFLRGGILGACEAAVFEAMRGWEERIRKCGAPAEIFHADFWGGAYEIYAPIQAHEAAQIHAGYYDEFEPAIAERLRRGAAMTAEEMRAWRGRQQAIVERTAELFTRFDFLLLPVMPVTQLAAGADNSVARPKILRYTTPASVAGLPAVVLPAKPVGMQLLAARGRDAELLGFARMLGMEQGSEIRD